MPAQKIWPVMPHAHIALRHVWPVGHSVPHVPQFDPSVLRFTHALDDAQYV